jgi:hypothetical protein
MLTLAEGKHTLTITPPPGYALVGPETRAVWLNGSDANLPPIGFAPDGKVSGIVFTDKDGDGWLSGTGHEFGLGDVTVTLDGPVMTTTATTVNGRFSLSHLPDGSYTVSTDLPLGYTATDMALTVSNGFGLVQMPVQSTKHLTGALYQDWDGDGLRLVDEGLVASVPFTVTVPSVGSTRPLGGSVLFWDVAPGSYTVEPLWGAAASANVELDTNSGGGVGLPAVSPGVVRGTLWLDANEDGLRQPWEAPLSGVLMTLDGGDSVATDENGRYAFYNVATGDHTVTAALPAGLSADPLTVLIEEDRGAVGGMAVKLGGTAVYLPIILR